MFIIFLPNFSGRFAENAIFVSTETFWGEVFLWKTSLLPLLSHIDRDFFGQMSIFFYCVVKIAFYLYRKMVWARNIEKLILFYLFGFWAKFFQVFFWKFVNGVVKTDFCIPRGTFCGKTFLLKKIIIFVIVAHWKKKDWILSKLFWLECQICILPVHWNFLRRKVLDGISFFNLWPLDNERIFFSDFCRKVLGCGIQNCNLHINRKFLWKVYFLQWKNLFFLFEKKIFWRVVFVWENIFFPFSWWWLKTF